MPLAASRSRSTGLRDRAAAERNDGLAARHALDRRALEIAERRLALFGEDQRDGLDGDLFDQRVGIDEDGSESLGETPPDG